MRYFQYTAIFFLVAAAAMLLPSVASAASITNVDTTLTAFQSGTGYTTKDNIKGRLTDGVDKSGRPKGVDGVKITISDPKGNVVATATTDENGNYDVDTTLNNVSGWTLTFNCDYIKGDMTL